MKNFASAALLILTTIYFCDVLFSSQVLSPPIGRGTGNTAPGSTLRGGIPGGEPPAPAKLPTGTRKLNCNRMPGGGIEPPEAS
jgi:hypothetical protein